MSEESMPEMVDKLIEALVAKGLVQANIKIEQDKYIFANGKLQIQLASPEKKKAAPIVPPAEKNKFETKILENQFYKDYFNSKKTKKIKKNSWLAIGAVVLAAMIVFLAIFWATGRLGRNNTRPSPSPQQEPQVAGANGASSEQDLADRNYDSLFQEATSLFAANQLDLSWQKAELAEKIKPTDELLRLKREIQKKQEAANAEAKLQDEKRKNEELAKKEIAVSNYLKTSRRFVSDGDFNKALENVYKARQIRPGPDVDEQEIGIKKVQADIANQKKLREKLNAEIAARQKADEENRVKAENAAQEKARASFLNLSKSLLKQGQPDKALKWLLDAKKIRSGPDLVALEKQIRDQMADNSQNLQKTEKSPTAATPAKETNLAQTDGASAMVQPAISAGRISDLNLNLTESFFSLVKRLEIFGMASDFAPSGNVTVTIKIDEKGNAQVQDINDNGLQVESESFRQSLRKSITGKLNGLQFPEPKNKSGERLRVENWRLNYKIGKYSGKIVMTRQ